MKREDIAVEETVLITDISDETSPSHENIATRDPSSNSKKLYQVHKMLKH